MEFHILTNFPLTASVASQRRRAKKERLINQTEKKLNFFFIFKRVEGKKNCKGGKYLKLVFD